MAHALYILDTQFYKHTFIICNTYCFPLQEWLNGRTKLLRYMYIACLVRFS